MEKHERKSADLPRFLLIALLLSLSLISYFYALEKVGLIPLSIISSLTFWIGVGLSVPKSFWRLTFFKVKKGHAYFLSSMLYLSFHILLYGIFFNIVLAAGLGQSLEFFPYLSSGFGVSIPPKPLLFPYWVSTSPGVWFFIGPFESDTTPYTLFLGFILALLIGANVESLLRLRKVIKAYKRTLLPASMIPTVAIVSGASCCLSLPSIIIYVIGVASGTIYSLLGVLASPWFFAFSYFGLPVGSLGILYLNLRDMQGWINRIERSVKDIK
ncbi:hypothetical protein GWK48_00015 [Metallosphaera tengchongensis]|uniref:Uncharacterized protein n=1 Tax=Metallosphaera tengchongensis TaxID=1532350 RepID=A0A6N0NQ39_9CREN|nr:hypothetical protein [Metallosphaera tengchongensis]QKQ98993.1 hypothetical protein GWK48_00015 [Metallosphaera tengchongensis]